jgi:Carboxypeptidase regulatory-like domain
MKIFKNISDGYKKIATGIAIVSFLAVIYIALIPGASMAFVTTASGEAISGALVFIKEWPLLYNDTTDGSGAYSIANVPIGTYNITASKEGYFPNTSQITVVEDPNNSPFNILLKPGFYTYFAEGYVTANNQWREYITVANPNDVAANVIISHMLSNGTSVDKDYTINSNTRFTETVGNVLTGANAPKIISDVPVIVERPIYFSNVFGGISEGTNTIGTTSLSKTWYFAEGYINPNFLAYLSIQNPNSSAANVKIKHVLGDGSTIWNNITINPTTRYTETVSNFVGSGNAVSFVITSDVPIVAERPIYFINAFGGTVNGGHNTIGASSLSKTWYFAEGYVTTDGKWKEYLTVGNPNDVTANVTASFMLSNGSTIERNYLINPNSRFTETVGNVLTGANSIAVTSNVSVVAERPMYFYGVMGGIKGGHNTIGATDLSNTWYFAEGYISPNFNTYLTIQNPNSSAANVKIKHVLGNSSIIWNNLTINPTSRYTETVSNFVDSGSVSFVVTSDVPIVAERPMYFINAFGSISGGHDTIGYSKLG